MTRFPAPGEADTAARLRGIVFICLAVFLFTLLDTAAKYAGRAVPTIEVAWARYAVNLLLAVIILRPWAFPASYRTGRPVAQTSWLLLVGRAPLGVAATVTVLDSLASEPDGSRTCTVAR